jgi:hypothetical protein
MRITGCSISVIPHPGKMLLEMLTVDSHWELDTVQLLKHICISGRREATRELGGPEPLSVGPAAHTRPKDGVRWAFHLTNT